MINNLNNDNQLIKLISQHSHNQWSISLVFIFNHNNKLEFISIMTTILDLKNVLSIYDVGSSISWIFASINSKFTQIL